MYTIDVKHAKFIARMSIKFLIALISLAIGLLGFMQYTWFSGSASSELDGEYCALASEASRAASREYQHYAALLGSLRSMGGETSMSQAEAESLLAPRLFHLRPVGFRAAAPVLGRHFLSIHRLDDARPNLLGLVVPSAQSARSLNRRGARPREGRARVPSGAAGKASFIIAPFGEYGFAIVEVDEGAFFDSYVKGAVASALRKASIEWSAVPGAGPRPGAREGRYPEFNPLSALFDPGAENGRAFDITVPASLAVPPLPRPGAFAFRGDLRLRIVRDEDGQGPGRAFSFMRGRVLMPADSTIGAIERRLSLYWLFDTILLLGIGAALALALIQVQKLRALRERERDFVASITHELRAPVTAIGSASDNMRRGLVGFDRMASYGEMIHAQALRLGAMIEKSSCSARPRTTSLLPPGSSRSPRARSKRS